jgi:hypothetical protein
MRLVHGTRLCVDKPRLSVDKQPLRVDKQPLFRVTKRHFGMIGSTPVLIGSTLVVIGRTPGTIGSTLVEIRRTPGIICSTLVVIRRTPGIICSTLVEIRRTPVVLGSTLATTGSNGRALPHGCAASQSVTPAYFGAMDAGSPAFTFNPQQAPLSVYWLKGPLTLAESMSRYDV